MGGAQEAGCGPPDSRSSLDLGDGLVDGLGHVVDVLGGQPAHVDAAAGHQVDVLLFDHVFNLFSCETKTQRIDVRKKKKKHRRKLEMSSRRRKILQVLIILHFGI